MSRARSRVMATVMTLFVLAAPAAAGQTPKPFPTPGAPQPARPAVPPATQPPPAPARAGNPNLPPTEATLGLPIFPNAQFMVSYDAGRGQRYYLFGSTSSFTEVVAYYRTALKNKGDLVFDAPATHMFEVGKFKEETMAFPPGITVKDYRWGGSEGYPNPKRGAEPARFPTVIQIVPLPEIGGQQ